MTSKLKTLPAEIRRNMIFHILDGAFFMGAMVFLDQLTIMTAFIRKVHNDPFIISLIPAAVAIGFNTPGFFTAPLIQKIRRKHLFIFVCGIIQRLMVLFLGLFTYILFSFTSRSAGLIASMIYFMFAFMGGFGGPAWVDLLARTVPTQFRARTIALRNSFGAAAGIIFPVVIGLILARIEFPGNYRYLFFIAFGFLVLSIVSFGFIKDKILPPPDKSLQARRSGYLDFIKKEVLKDRNFLFFLLGRFFFSFALISSGFLTVYYLENSPEEGDSIVAYFALALNVSKVVSGLALGFFGDRKGNLLVLRIGVMAMLGFNILALLTSSFSVFLIIYVLLGITISADINTYQGLISEFGHDGNRVFYVALGNSFSGTLAGLLPIFAGTILSVGLMNYRTLFFICIVMALPSFLVFKFLVKDPRLALQKKIES